MNNKVFVFKDNEIGDTVNIVIGHITSYGITAGEFKSGTNLPTRGVLWVNVGNINHNRNLSYEMAVSLEQDITEAIHLLDEETDIMVGAI